jgi:hypothetical protein
VGHSDIKLTMDVYGKIAGKMTLAKEEETRFDALATKALPAEVLTTPTADSGTETITDSDRKLADDVCPPASG